MTKFPYISVIVPVYNAESTLSTCVDSILAQSFADFELIVVDDGSTDSSSCVIDGYVTADSRVRHISRQNGGVSSARNAGLDVASGKYVCFVDSDDMLPADVLDILAAATVQPFSSHSSNQIANIESEKVTVEMVVGGYVSLGDGKVFCPPCAGVYSDAVKFAGLGSSSLAGSDVCGGKLSGTLSLCIDDNYRFRSSLFRAVWGKLFLRSSIGDLRFDQSFSYGEDVVFIWSFIMRCSRSFPRVSGGDAFAESVSDSKGSFDRGSDGGCIVTVKSPVYMYSDTPGGLGSGLGTDRHISQLLRFIPAYKLCLENLSATFPSSKAVASMYHEDLVGRLVCRALTVFATRPTSMMNRDSLSMIYSVMDSDSSLSKSHGLKSVFSLRKGQIINLLLYRIHSVGFTMSFYRLSSLLCHFLHIHPKKY